MSDLPVEERDYTVFDNDIEGKRFDFQLLSRLFSWLKPYRARAALAVACVLLAATATVLAPVIVTRVVIDGMLLPGEGMEAPDMGQTSLVSWFSDAASLDALLAACVIYGGWVLMAGLFAHLFRILLAGSVLSGLKDLRRDVFAHLERLPATFYDRVAVGRVMTRVTNDIETLFELLSGFGVLMGEFVPFFVAITIMVSINPELTGMLLLLMPIAAVATYIFRMASRKIYRDIRSSLSRLNENLQENLSGMEVVQLYQREEINFDRYSGINSENRHQENRAVVIESLYGPAMDSLIFLAMATIIWFGGAQVVGADVTLGSIILFASFTEMLFRPIVAMGEQWNVLFRAMASCERIFQALDWKEALTEPASPKVLPTQLSGAVCFNKLNFEYRSGNPILKDVSFDIAAGEKIAIVGPTGSGKTTLIRLLCRFYDVAPGEITIDGVDIMDVAPSEVRRKVGVVLQDFHIFSGSIYDNIALGDPTISREAAIEAAKTVNADTFIRQLPLGYDTPLVERGRNLSHGQRQLLAFARVLAVDPDILILDEATASVDTETELVIQDALRKLTEGRTSIIIAHRLQTIREADRIVVLAQGEVREIGPHDALMAQGGLYATLYELQVQETD
ncbi:MAG: ABC transporter [Parvibaculum sp.]|nr:ABC transporter [Parvibaculum sp.]